jgi:hypothetical protein
MKRISVLKREEYEYGEKFTMRSFIIYKPHQILLE